MDTNNIMADMADEVALETLEVELQGDILFFDGCIAEFGVTKTDKKTPYARFQTFGKDASALAVLGVPQGRISGVPQGQAIRLFAVQQSETVYRYVGHQPLALTSLARAAKPGAAPSKADVQAKLNAAGKAKANPKATL